jgi:AraC-like DNA-binding protein
MPVILDHQLREQMHHISPEFPITYFHDELIALPNREGPVHWHPEFEIVTAETGVLDYQVGKEHIPLYAGDSIFVNTNMLHGIRQTAGDTADPMPGIVFLGSLIAPEGSVIYQKYIHRISACDQLPYVIFRRNENDQIHQAVRQIYRFLEERRPLYELGIQRELISIFEYLNLHFEELPRSPLSRVQINARVRVQQMLSFIYDHYAENISLSDISSAASISRSEAGRCFMVYMQSSPIDYLIRYRLRRASSLLADTTMTVQEISQSCGFHSLSYFSRKFRQYYGCAPGSVRSLGK